MLIVLSASSIGWATRAHASTGADLEVCFSARDAGRIKRDLDERPVLFERIRLLEADDSSDEREKKALRDVNRILRATVESLRTGNNLRDEREKQYKKALKKERRKLKIILPIAAGVLGGLAAWEITREVTN